MPTAEVYCAGCDRFLNLHELELAEAKAGADLLCGSCRDGATIADLKACLRDLMDAADRDRQGSPLPYEEWRIRYDEARRLAGPAASARKDQT